MSDSDLREYLESVLKQLKLTKQLPLKPSLQEVRELQNIDRLLQETEERIKGFDKLETFHSSKGDLKAPTPELPAEFKQIRRAWLVQMQNKWAVVSRGGKTIADFPTREEALVWWSLVTAEEPGKARPILMDGTKLTVEDQLTTKKKKSQLKKATKQRPTTKQSARQQATKKTKLRPASKPKNQLQTKPAKTLASKPKKPKTVKKPSSRASAKPVSFKGKEFVNEPFMPYNEKYGMAEWDAR